MTGGPISDRRLIEEKDGRIYFWARSGDKSGRLEVASLPVQEFVRRWTTHILPKRFTKSRCYGGWSNTRREAYHQQCESLSPSPIPIPTSSPTPDDTTTLADASLIEANPDRPPCPKCGTPMELLFNHHRPSWSDPSMDLVQGFREKSCDDSISPVASRRKLLRTRDLAIKTALTEVPISAATRSARSPFNATRVNASQVSGENWGFVILSSFRRTC